MDGEGECEAADDLDGFGPNPARADGIWPEPPRDMIDEARRIALVKATDPEGDDEDGH